MPKRIPYAIASFEEIVHDGYHFVDKTRFIHELEKYKIPVFLRPRRFGKSLWCSILECYYDINRKDQFEVLFGNTDIGRNPTDAHNTHLVLRFDFSRVAVAEDVASLRVNFRNVCLEALKTFLVRYAHHIPAELALTQEAPSDLLNTVIGAIERSNAPRLNVIIDEYDNFTNQLLTMRKDSLYKEVTTGDSFLRAFFKVLKSAVGEQTVDRIFVTGVLPVTMDDLTSGFNIGQIITLEEHVLEMMGFTQAEVDVYVDEIFREHAWSADKRQKVRDDLRSHYNGYRLLPDAQETLYNSTILNFYLNKLVIGNGRLPREMIDDNLRVDINWLRRLTGSDAETRTLLEQLMFEGSMPVDMAMLRSKFNMEAFFERRFFPLSLYYLGMLTFQDDFTLQFPNLTVKTIFTEYFNEMEHISVSEGYTDMFRQFLKDHDLAALFAGYWKQYVGQIPAQAFDKVNENFFRTTFYELCTRYLSRYLILAIETNHASGRSDWEAVGRDGTAFAGEAMLLEFKHYPRDEGKRLGLTDWTAALPEDVEQVTGYAHDLKTKYPELTVHRHLVYTVSCADFRFFTL